MSKARGGPAKKTAAEGGPTAVGEKIGRETAARYGSELVVFGRRSSEAGNPKLLKAVGKKLGQAAS